MRYLVNPARALQLWNQTNESLPQLADRFAGVTGKHVRESIEHAVEIGLGTLARPLPEKGQRQPAAPAAPRIPKPPREPKPPRPPREPKPPRPPRLTKGENNEKRREEIYDNLPVAFRENIPKAAPFNPEVEEILAEKEKEPGLNNPRKNSRDIDSMLIEWAEIVVAEKAKFWCGKTPIPWLDHKRIRAGLLRQRRDDLWEYLKKIYMAYQHRNRKTTLEIYGDGNMVLRHKQKAVYVPCHEPRPRPIFQIVEGQIHVYKDTPAARARREERAARKAEGLCGVCGKNPNVPGRIRCEACREKHTVANIGARAQRRKEYPLRAYQRGELVASA